MAILMGYRKKQTLENKPSLLLGHLITFKLLPCMSYLQTIPICDCIKKKNVRFISEHVLTIRSNKVKKLDSSA